MSNTIQPVLDSIVDILERRVIGIQATTSMIYAGDTIIDVPSSRRYNRDETISLSDADSQEIHCIKSIINGTQIELIQAVYSPFALGAMVQPLIRGQHVSAVLPYNPPSLAGLYPALTVEAVTRAPETPLTIGSVEDITEIDVSIWVDSASLETSSLILNELTDRCINDLFKRYHIIPSFDSTTLISDIEDGDTTIRVNDGSIIIPDRFIVIENADHTEYHRVLECLDNGVYRVSSPISDFKSGDSVLVPRRWIFQASILGVDYSNTDIDENVTWQSNVIHYEVREEIIRSSYLTGFGGVQH